MPTENDLRPADPIVRTTNLSAEIKKMYGPKWNAPSPSYEFSNGRKFELRTEDAAIYVTSEDF